MASAQWELWSGLMVAKNYQLSLRFGRQLLYLFGQYTAGSPIGLAPVGFVQVGNHHPFGFGGMGESARTEIDAHMAASSRVFEKDQITALQGAVGDLLTTSHLVGGGAWQTDTEQVVVNPLDESGTVHSGTIGAPQFVRGALPLIHRFPKLGFTVRWFRRRVPRGGPV